MPHCCKLSSMKKPCNCQEKLPENFTPGRFDVICARGKRSKTWPGNVLYQRLIESYMNRYVAATSKLQKMSIISEIVTKVRLASPDGGFVKLKEGRWFEVGDHFAREKVSQSLRDSLHVLYRSSCKSKTIRRAIRRQQEEKQKDLAEASKIHQLPRSAIPSSLLVHPPTLPLNLATTRLSAFATAPLISQKLLGGPSADAELMVARILLAQAQARI